VTVSIRESARLAALAVLGALLVTSACSAPTSQPSRYPAASQQENGDASSLTRRPKPLRIVAVGDISRDRIGEQKRTARLVRSLEPSRVLLLGDIQYPAGTYHDFMTYYDPSWGRFNDKVLSAPGNHEYETPGAAGYLRYFGRRAHPLGHTYFSRTVGRWHVVSLDSNIDRDGRSREVRWLRRDLRDANQDCIMAIWHHPRFSSGTEHGDDPSVTPFWRALYRARADAVLNGHEHNYERFARQRPSGVRARHGIREFVVGTGGGGLYPFGPPTPHSQKRVAGVFGALVMDLRPHAYRWKFVAVGGRVLDHGRTACN
jgi:hypothetical protein